MRFRGVRVILLASEQRAIISFDPPLSGDEQPIVVNLSFFRPADGEVFIDRVTATGATIHNTTRAPAVVAVVIVASRLSPAALTWAQQFFSNLLGAPRP